MSKELLGELAYRSGGRARDSLLASLGPEHPITLEALPDLNRILGASG